MGALLRHEVLSRRGAAIGWGIGLSIFVFIYMGFYPQIGEQFRDMDLSQIPAYQIIGNFNMATFAGYFSSTILNFLPILLAVYAIIAGTGALAGEEERGTLELILAQPHPRWQVVTAKAVALLLVTFVILVIAILTVLLIFYVIRDSVEAGVGAADLVVATLYAWPMIAALVMISLFLSAFMPNRRLAAVVATAVLVISYFGNNLAGMAEPLKQLEGLFLHRYYRPSAAVVQGQIEWGNVAVLLGVAFVAYLLAVFFFQRRNVTVGAWPWQRASARP